MEMRKRGRKLEPVCEAWMVLVGRRVRRVDFVYEDKNDSCQIRVNGKQTMRWTHDGNIGWLKELQQKAAASVDGKAVAKVFDLGLLDRMPDVRAQLAIRAGDSDWSFDSRRENGRQ